VECPRTRRYYQLTKEGAERARLALAEISARHERRRSSLSTARLRWGYRCEKPPADPAAADRQPS